MKTFITITRITMGLLFLVMSVAFFFHLMPQPVLSDDAKLFVTGLGASSYLLPLVKVIELICAIAFISGRFVSLATVVIFPVIVNIVLFHAFLAPEGIFLPALLFLENMLLAYHHREDYRMMLRVK